MFLPITVYNCIKIEFNCEKWNNYVWFLLISNLMDNLSLLATYGAAFLLIISNDGNIC